MSSQLLPALGLEKVLFGSARGLRGGSGGAEAEFRAIWAAVDMRNDRIKLASQTSTSGPVSFRPFEDTLRDCVESLVLVGGVEPAMKEGAPPLPARL